MHQLEKDAHDAVRNFARENKELLSFISSWGDGRCGHIAELLCEELGIAPDNTTSATEECKSKSRPVVSKAKRNAVLDEFGNKCLCCGSYDDICIDHVVPLSLGGFNRVDNMQPLCRSCNSKKGVKTIDYRKQKTR